MCIRLDPDDSYVSDLRFNNLPCRSVSVEVAGSLCADDIFLSDKLSALLPELSKVLVLEVMSLDRRSDYPIPRHTKLGFSAIKLS